MASLDSRIRDIDRAKIAKQIVDWKELSPYLGLSAAEQKVVEKSDRSHLQQTCEAIRKWQQKNGDDATYGAFIEVATVAENKELADYVRKLVVGARDEQQCSHTEKEGLCESLSKYD